MELRAFAERILFSGHLEEKLLPPPEGITDEHPGPAIMPPPAPGRPEQLRFKQSQGPSEFPGLHRLEDRLERGRLLHFFANHELLATELMALVLLRFPDAPPAFRRGVLATLRDEQDHTRLYLERIRGCGLEFGDLPVSGYFWRSVAPMENPIDYVAGLCLTFEQANLDFCRQFGAAFSTVGDADTARLMDRIYRDEIGHVAYGLKWFRRWKNPALSDWDAFCRQLRFPLSPQRAKGLSLNVEGRRAAGLDPDFIAHLEVFAQSKGRTPDVHDFNPFAEGFLAFGKAFNPNRHQADLARDLENLPQFLARQDDIVLVSRRPPIELLAALKRAGLPLPEFIETSPETCLDRHPALAGRKLGRFRPWAWSPESLARLAPLLPQSTLERRPADACFNPSIARLYSKSWSADFLRGILSDTQPAWLCPPDVVGFTARSRQEATALIESFRARGHFRLVVKQAFGVAGGNAVRLWEPELTAPQLRWLEQATSGGREVVVEPWLERLADFSVQWEMTAEALKLVGYAGLWTDLKGQFLGNFAGPDFSRRPPAVILRQFPSPPDLPRVLAEFYADLGARLGSAIRTTGYRGPVGIDAFVYRGPDGLARLKPIVEINPRHTMGRVTLELMRHTDSGTHGAFRLVNAAALREGGFPDFAAFARARSVEHPPLLRGQPVPRLREGFLCLNDPVTARACLATFQASRSPPG